MLILFDTRLAGFILFQRKSMRRNKRKSKKDTQLRKIFYNLTISEQKMNKLRKLKTLLMKINGTPMMKVMLRNLLFKFENLILLKMKKLIVKDHHQVRVLLLDITQFEIS